ncbi:MAG: family 16 glycosylhydrolase [Spirochaetes bacterium]|nr:family 16 glycosylhydrolase [Spirochaetota bacterium]
MRIAIVAVIAVMAQCLFAEAPAGVPLYNKPFIEAFVPAGDGITVVDVQGQPFAKAFHITVPEKTKQPWDISLEGMSPKPVGKGMIILSFYLRMISSGTEGDSCSVVSKILTRPEVEQIMRSESAAGPQWKRVSISASVKKEYPADKVALSLMFGNKKQEVEIGGLEMIYLDEAASRDMAKIRPRINGLPAAPAGQQWKMIWNDEFDGTAVDETKWNIQEGPRHDAIRSRKAVSLDGKGSLVMTIFREGDTFYNAWVDTAQKFEHAYGFYTARMKMQKSAGHWCAFWLQTRTTGNVDGSGRDGSEIDIMEKPWLNDEVNHAIHWDGYGKDHKNEGLRSVNPGVMEGWHTFSLLWTPDEYVIYIDDLEVWRSKAGGVCQVPAEIRLTDEAQKKDNSWAGSVLKAALPDSWYVDYVRVYDLVDAAGKPVYQSAAVAEKKTAAAPVTAPADGNLVQNGGFETDGVWSENNWAKNDTSVSRDMENPKSGSACQKITLSAVKGSSPITELIQPLKGLMPGMKAKLRFWARGTAENALKVQLRQVAPPFTAHFEMPVMLTENWQEYSADITVPEQAVAPFRLTFRIEQKNTVWLDDVSIIPAP